MDGLNLTRPYGEQGQIEYKSNWGQPISESGEWLAAGEQPQAQTQTQAQIQRPSANTLINTDPLVLLNQRADEEATLFESAFAQQYADLTKDSDNALQVLDQEYQIRIGALQQEYDSTPKNQRDEKYAQRMATRYNDLAKQYAVSRNKIWGKIQPDIQDLQMSFNLKKQQMEFERNNKVRRIQEIDQLHEEGVIQDDAAATAKKYSIATGVNYSASEFRPPKTNESDLLSISLQIASLEEAGRYEEAKTLENQLNQMMGGASPEEAEVIQNTKNAARQASRFSGLADRQKRRQAAKEQPGTLTEGIVEAKNKAAEKSEHVFKGASAGMTYPYKGVPKSAKRGPKPVYANNPATGQRIVSFDEGRTWQMAQ